MDLIRAVAISILKDSEFGGEWPNAFKEHPQATSFSQVSNYEIEFDQPFDEWESYRGISLYTTYEVEGMPYIEEYQTGDTVTKEEFEAYLAANPNLLEDIANLQPINTAKIAELNKQVGELIDEMTRLADEIGVDVYISLGQHGSLNPNSDWDSSRC